MKTKNKKNKTKKTKKKKKLRFVTWDLIFFWRFEFARVKTSQVSVAYISRIA